eukprot:ctg_2058.g528
MDRTARENEKVSGRAKREIESRETPDIRIIASASWYSALNESPQCVNILTGISSRTHTSRPLPPRRPAAPWGECRCSPRVPPIIEFSFSTRVPLREFPPRWTVTVFQIADPPRSGVVARRRDTSPRWPAECTVLLDVVDHLWRNRRVHSRRRSVVSARFQRLTTNAILRTPSPRPLSLPPIYPMEVSLNQDVLVRLNDVWSDVGLSDSERVKRTEWLRQQIIRVYVDALSSATEERDALESELEAAELLSRELEAELKEARSSAGAAASFLCSQEHSIANSSSNSGGGYHDNRSTALPHSATTRPGETARGSSESRVGAATTSASALPGLLQRLDEVSRHVSALEAEKRRFLERVGGRLAGGVSRHAHPDTRLGAGAGGCRCGCPAAHQPQPVQRQRQQDAGDHGVGGRVGHPAAPCVAAQLWPAAGSAGCQNYRAAGAAPPTRRDYCLAVAVGAQSAAAPVHCIARAGRVGDRPHRRQLRRRLRAAGRLPRVHRGVDGAGVLPRAGDRSARRGARPSIWRGRRTVSAAAVPAGAFQHVPGGARHPEPSLPGGVARACRQPTGDAGAAAAHAHRGRAAQAEGAVGGAGHPAGGARLLSRGGRGRRRERRAAGGVRVGGGAPGGRCTAGAADTGVDGAATRLVREAHGTGAGDEEPGAPVWPERRTAACGRAAAGGAAAAAVAGASQGVRRAGGAAGGVRARVSAAVYGAGRADAGGGAGRAGAGGGGGATAAAARAATATAASGLRGAIGGYGAAQVVVGGGGGGGARAVNEKIGGRSVAVASSGCERPGDGTS